MFIALAFLAAAPLAAQPPVRPGITRRGVATHYAVIFEVTTDATGTVTRVAISKVIDAGSGSTNAVDVAVPDAYVAAARILIEAKAKANPAPSETYYTYFFFDPAAPGMGLPESK